MSDCVWLLRHGDTEWSEQELHTGRRDVPLSDSGRRQARTAGKVLSHYTFAHVLVSPQSRAQETAELAGVARHAEPVEDLAEWDYGEYEGLTDSQVQGIAPGWDLFRDGAPGGESPPQLLARVERVLERVAALEGVCLLVGHGKLLRALAARWVGYEIELGSTLPLDPAAISLLERERPTGPLLRLWNFTDSLLNLEPR